jgi:tetratricopeptide (TPR) repeat protein
MGSVIAERLLAQAIAWQCGTAPQTAPRHFLRAAPPRRRPLPGWRHPAIWRRRGDLDAIAEYNEAIRLNPEYAPAYLARGIAWEIKHGLQEALADFKMYSQLAPSDPRGSRGSGARTGEMSAQ